MTTVTFVPWVAAGAGASLSRDSGSDGKNRPHVIIDLDVTNTSGASAQARGDLRMLGPGDVLGVPAGQVIRTEPSNGATNVDVTIFPSVDFDAPFLPWIFTGTRPDPASAVMAPWLCLVVVPERDGVTLDARRKRLSIESNAGQELPDLSEAAFWVHAQYSGPLDDRRIGDVVVALSDPTASLSRLVCPRVLIPNTRYDACIVPTTSAGRDAGLGQSPGDDEDLTPAWSRDDERVVLPVYYSFSFRTGEGGDFKSLALALAHPPKVSAGGPEGIGDRSLAARWTEGTDDKEQTFRWPSILQVPPPGGSFDPTENQSGLERPPEGLAAWLRDAITPTHADPHELRIPIYGAVQAGIRPSDLLDSAFTLPAWIDQLVSDPRLRAFAAMGSEVVIRDREAITAAAFHQVGGARDVNAHLSRAQLGRAVASRLVRRHLDPLEDVAFLRVMSPHAGRMAVTIPGGAGAYVGSLAGGLGAADPALRATVSAPYRRLSRPRGPLGRNGATRGPLNTGGPPFTAASQSPIPGAQAARVGIDPEVSVSRRVHAEWLSPEAAELASARNDPLRQIAPGVEFRGAMFQALFRLSRDAVLPNIGAVPRDTALLLQDTPDAIAAYMVGLNYEVSRLLQWRHVPTDRRATPFRRFWGGPDPDMMSLRDHGPAGDDALATRLVRSQPRSVLLFRSDLFRRYPRTAVYAVSASDVDGFVLDECTNVVEPEFKAQIDPDLQLIGFPDDVPPGVLTGDEAPPTPPDPKPGCEAQPAVTPDAAAIPHYPGYFIVLQDQVSETRFGTDALAVSTPPDGSNHWSIAAIGEAAGGPQATTDSAAVANAVRMRPAMVAIHARLLLPLPATQPPGG